jgi:hypothetical protein
MEKQAQPMSPRTQAFAAGMPAGDEETRLFEEGLSQMAYNVLVAKFPDLIQHVITFKILDTDVETGSGAGAFVVQHGDDVIYIPVIMADNQIKPMDLFYHKNLNVFLPLNNDWLSEVNQLTLEEMGEAVTAPKSLRRDMDTRNIMIPPTTGRYAYAASKDTTLDINGDLYRMCEHLQREKVASGPVLLQFLEQAPEVIKEAFVNILQSRPKLASQVTLMYGLDPLCFALEKRATQPDSRDEEGELNVADRKTTANEFKETFGDRAPEAFQGMLAQGYAAKDTRKNLNAAVQVQEPKDLCTPTQSGFFKVFTTKGEALPAFVICEPRKILHCRHTQMEDSKGRRQGAKKHPRYGFEAHSEGDFLVILKDSRWVRCRKLTAEPAASISGYEPSAEHKTLFGKLLNLAPEGDRPTVGARGVFLKKLGQTFVGTEPFRIKKVSTDAQGVRRIVCDDFDNTTLITDPNAPKAGLHQPKGEPIVYVPGDARFVKLKEHSSESDSYMAEKTTPGVQLLSNPSDVCKWFGARFDAMGADSVSVKNASAGEFSVDGETPLHKLAAMERAARKHSIPFSAAELLVKQAAARSNGRATARIVTPQMWAKVAQMPMMDPTSGGAPPPPGAAPAPGGDPAAMGGDPAAMGAAPPPPAQPSPLDIAMGEAQTQMSQQAADLQQQQMALEDKANTLAMVGQRAQEIAMGGAEAVQQGAPPMMGGAPGMPPGGAPPQGGAPMPGPAPMAAGNPAGADPATMPQTMGAAMTTENPSAMEIQNQVNPQFLEQAAQMEDPSTFDAAAIASMSQNPSFRDMVIDYVPTLERSLDNLGRIMVTMWMQEGELKQQLGDEDYSELEDNIRAVFEGLGELILQMNRNAIVMQREM